MNQPQSNFLPPSCFKTIWLLAARELRLAVVSRWFVLYTAAFVALSLSVSYVSATILGSAGLSGFGRTSAGLINIVLLIVPLMAMTAGAGSIAGDRERGSLGYLLCQPVRRWELLLSRYFALTAALATSITLGFGLSAIVLAFAGSTAKPQAFLLLVALAVLLAAAMLSVGLLISVLSSRTSVATGIAIFLWLALVFGTDLALMAGTLAGRISIEWLFNLALLSPLQVFKMWSLQSVDATLDVLGPVGLYGQTVHGPRLTPILATALSAWIVLPLAAAIALFQKRSVL
jgi:Cu-processing system permease protein